MADKTIGELPAISTLSDAAMLPVEQNGAAGRISGEQFKNYAIDSAAEQAGIATQAASNASDSATAAAGSATQAANSALSANGSANQAIAAKEKIENMTVSSTTLDPGSAATVVKSESGGVINIAFGIPRGSQGIQGIQGPAGPQGIQGPKGDTGTAVAVPTEGMYYFSVDNNSESANYGHLFLTYSGDTAPNFSINEDGHLIWEVE